MTRAPQRFDADPRAYVDYLRTPLGRLRSELSWRNLEPHLPHPGTLSRRALDLGAGTGEMALRLAAVGWSVTLVDGSPRMLDLAAEAATARGLAERVACRTLDLDARGLVGGLGAGAYDLVICHDVLEYVASPEALLREARAALVAGGRVSLVVRNRSGEVMKRLLRAADPGAAIGLLVAERVKEDMYGLELRLFDAAGLRTLVRAAGLLSLVERGVRVVADYLPDEMLGGDGAFERMLEVEHRLGESPEIRAVARYLQLIATRGGDPPAP